MKDIKSEFSADIYILFLFTAKTKELTPNNRSWTDMSSVSQKDEALLTETS